jgi:hypothetical protein
MNAQEQNEGTFQKSLKLYHDGTSNIFFDEDLIVSDIFESSTQEAFHVTSSEVFFAQLNQMSHREPMNTFSWTYNPQFDYNLRLRSQKHENLIEKRARMTLPLPQSTSIAMDADLG